jgi:hypothetical protein
VDVLCGIAVELLRRPAAIEDLVAAAGDLADLVAILRLLGERGSEPWRVRCVSVHAVSPGWDVWMCALTVERAWMQGCGR